MFACGMRTDRYEPGEPNFEAIKNLIETHDVDVNVQNSDGVTPL
jgi:ankyrin repeat protein